MTTASRPVNKSGNRFRSLLCSSFLVCLIGMASSQPAQAAVTVDQSPLTVQQPLPPNVVLMLDDSGSMAWDFMPDQGYLASTTNDGYRDAANNGTYYNPTVIYSPPPHADGTSYPNSPELNSAYYDGFLNQTATDITRYTGTYNYYTRFPITTTYTYNPTSQQVPSCSGSYPNYYGGLCYNNSYSKWISPTYTTKLVCNGSDVLNSSNKCVGTTTTYKYYFTYTTGPAAGPYTQHYVAMPGDCASLSSTNQLVCDESAATRQNVANWFSYYRTRILLAKSGLMTSFSTVDPTFRVGFGSINGRNNGALPSPTSIYNGKTISNVQPFGDGSAGTQKSNFWTWIVGEVPNNSTPLRVSLDAVGQYYESAQPWQTSASDSTELACRQSYTILTTDGFWNETWNSGPGNSDGSAGPTVTGPNGQSYTYSNVAPYTDANSNTLADVAMKYWKMDLRTTVANEVPPSTEDPAFWQHMTTFTLGLGFVPTGISPSGTTIDQIFSWANGGAAISNFSWPTPAADSIYNIADLAHAAVNGHGGFYSATSPESFTSGLVDALKRATERVGTGASLAANSTQLKTGTVAYQANYYTSKWKGDLKAFPIDATTGAIATSPSWSAATALPAAASRNIYTYDRFMTPANKQYTAFKDPTNLSTTMLAAIGSTATEQQNIINYLRGDASKEQKNTGGIYRSRDTALGDIVDSQPVFVGAPDTNQFYTQSFTGTTTFAQYASDNGSRTSQILVAANDGMLHIFNGDTGAETYAYLPGAVVLGGVNKLADPNYGASTPHQYFNDGELTVADVYYSNGWHTVAIGTTGRGNAKAVYALDITDPTAPTFLWERSAGDGLTNSNYIGQMTGKPVVAQTADGVWSVLIGNGYNSSAGVAALLQFKVSDGTLTVHATDTSANNGLASPGVWIDSPSSGIGSTAYAGDRLGRVWSFTLNDGTSAKPSSAGTLLFSAVDAASAAQPITSGMLVGKDPATSNVWVFFGTGQYLSNGDLSDKSTQTWYGLIVQSADTSLVTKLSQGRGNLVQRSIVAESVGSLAPTVVAPARAVTPTPSASDMTGKSGWYMDLTSPLNGAEGERMVTPNQFQGNLLLATTRIPIATDLCNPSGRGWIMAVNPFSGTNPSSSFFDINGDGTIGSGDTFTDADGNVYSAAGVGFSSLPNNPIFVGSTMLVSFDNGTTGSIKTSNTSGGIKRVSWRELINQ